MKLIPEQSSIATEIVDAIQKGETTRLDKLLSTDNELASARIDPREEDSRRSLLHIATDWPGHFPNVAETIKILVSHGADPNAEINGPDTETPLHWAASSNDVEAIDALLDAGANMDVQGAVIAGGDPLEDAVGFQNWKAARRLVERGAKTKLGDEAALGLMDKIAKRFDDDPLPSPESINYSFWNACCAGQIESAKYLHEKGADVNWSPDWCEENSLDSAIKHKYDELTDWLKSNGAVQHVTSKNR